MENIDAGSSTKSRSTTTHRSRLPYKLLLSLPASNTHYDSQGKFANENEKLTRNARLCQCYKTKVRTGLNLEKVCYFENKHFLKLTIPIVPVIFIKTVTINFSKTAKIP